MEERMVETPEISHYASESESHPLASSGAPSDGSNIASDHRSVNTRPPVPSAAKPPPIPAMRAFDRISTLLPSASALSHESAPDAVPNKESSSSLSAPMQRSASLSSIFPQALSGPPTLQHDEVGGSQVISHPLMADRSGNQGDEQPLSPQSLSRHSSYRSRSPSLGPASPTASASSSTGATGNYASRVSSRSPSFSKDIVSEPAIHFQERRGSSFPFRKLSVQDVSSDIGSLQKLARQGSWRAIIEKIKETRKRDIVHSPDEQLSYTSYYVLALMKLRNYGAAADELTALGDLESPKFRYEASLHFEKSGSMVPFGLRWLHAILPRWLGETAKASDRLYSLLAHCNKKIDHLEECCKDTGGQNAGAAPEFDLLTGPSDAVRPLYTGIPSSHVERGEEGEQVRSNSFNPDDANEDLDNVVSSAPTAESKAGCHLMLEKWRRRQEMVLHTALAHHLNEKEFLVAMTLLENLLKSRPSDSILLSKYGYVQLLVGDIDGAKSTFSAVETIIAKQGISHGLLANLVARNRGLLLFALKQYPAASKKFDAVLKQDPSDEIAANNKALCLMYSRDLVGATQVLEDVLQRSPLTALNEPLVLNLCSMYELSSMNSTEAKRTLSSWIMRIAPDDFDMTCTRL